MFCLKARIISNKKIKGRFYHCAIASGKLARQSLPGQFVQIKVAPVHEPLLRRPFSIHGVNGKNIEIIYEVVGQATRILSQRKKGEYLDVIGPLGKGFDYSSQVLKPLGSVILVAGGMGVAPLIFLAEKIAKFKIKNQKSKILVLIGAKTKNQILCEKEFKNLGCNVKIATDDGSCGFKGRVTELLMHLPSTINHQPSTIYACGPHPMLREVSRLSVEYKIPAQVSLEEHMSCGIGACMGCVVKIKNPCLSGRQETAKIKDDFKYNRVCKEGPVFDAVQIIWE